MWRLVIGDGESGVSVKIVGFVVAVAIVVVVVVGGGGGGTVGGGKDGVGGCRRVVVFGFLEDTMGVLVYVFSSLLCSNSS